MLSRTIASAVGLFASAGSAWGGAVFLGTQGTTLYRTDGVTVETFTLSTDLTSMALGPDGTIWGSALTDADGDGKHELYTLSDPLGPAPSLVLHSDFLAENTPTLTFVGNTLYGVQKTPGAHPTTAELVTIDLVALTQTIAGTNGLMGIAPNGSGYDPASGSFYGIRGGGLIPPAELYDIDFDLTLGPNPTASPVGGMGLLFVNGGAEFFGGTLYALIQEGLESGTERLLLGTVDTGSGGFTITQVLDNRLPGAVALVVIPEPATIGLFGLLSLVALRRRR